MAAKYFDYVVPEPEDVHFFLQSDGDTEWEREEMHWVNEAQVFAVLQKVYKLVAHAVLLEWKDQCLYCHLDRTKQGLKGGMGQALISTLSRFPVRIKEEVRGELDNTLHRFSSVQVNLDRILKRVGILKGESMFDSVYYEAPSDWDLTLPTREVPQDTNGSDIPAWSKLRTSAMVLTAVCLARHLALNPVGFKYRMGPSSQERLAIWHKDDAQRRRLASFLLSNHPEILIDMTHDPMRPWKGMYFFHGTSYAQLQDDSDECQLKFAEADDVYYSAFTTPYFTKAMNYAKTEYVYIYRLEKDGMELKMLDLREDYARGNEGLWEPIHKLAGIEHTGKGRTFKMWNLYELFRDAGIDGAIVNMDIEWVWFDPSKLLRHVKPENDFQRALSHGATDDAIMGIWEYQISPERLSAFLKGRHVVRREVDTQDLPYLRWHLDLETLYANQFMAVHPAYPTVWKPRITEFGSHLVLFECRYEDLWQALAPDALHLYMGATVTEGSHDRVLPYEILCVAIDNLNDDHGDFEIGWEGRGWIALAVHLPNGHILIVYPFSDDHIEHTSDARFRSKLLPKTHRKRGAREAIARSSAKRPHMGARLLLM